MAKIALQLYTVRDNLQEDVISTIQQVAEIGYQHVELYDLLGYSPEEMRSICSDCGLSIPSWMARYEQLRDSLGEIIETAKVLGCKYVVCPWLAEDYRNVSGYTQVGETLGSAGVELARHGLTLCYHNHQFEFERLDDDQTGFDILYGESSANSLKAELDVYWAALMNRDPVTLMNELDSKVALVHMKDMACDANRSFSEVGEGCLDIPAIATQADACGLEYLIVEQDGNWKESPLKSAKTSFENLTRHLSRV